MEQTHLLAFHFNRQVALNAAGRKASILEKALVGVRFANVLCPVTRSPQMKKVQVALAAGIVVAAALMVATSAEPFRRPAVATTDRAATLTMPSRGVWQSAYDDTIDGQLKVQESPLVEVAFHNDRLTGRYQHLRAVGKDNNSIFIGSVVRGKVPMITLRQDHKSGYIAIYTGKLVAPNRFVGTYMDNTGGSGDWSFELQSQPEPAAPAATLPNVDRSDAVK